MLNVPAPLPDTVPSRRETPFATTATFMSRKFSFFTCNAIGSGGGSSSSLGEFLCAHAATMASVRITARTRKDVERIRGPREWGEGTSNLPVRYDEPGSRAFLFVIRERHAQVRPAHMAAERDDSLIRREILALQPNGNAPGSAAARVVRHRAHEIHKVRLVF